MVEAAAESKEEEKAKSPEEIKKDEEATKLLKELEEEETTETKTDQEGEAEKKEEESAEAKSEADESESQSEKSGTPKKKGFERRVSRLVKQREEAKGETDEVARKLHDSEEEKKLLRMRIDQLTTAKEQEIKEPDPEMFDAGDIDPDYLIAKREFDKAQRESDKAEFRKIAREEAVSVAKEEDQTAAQAKKASDLKRKQEEHWKQADELGAKDYDEAEEKVVKLLGADMVNNIIDYFPGESHLVTFYLGLDSNIEEAEELSEMFSSGPGGLVKGVAEVGRILERIKANPLKTSINPDPDVETEGSAPSPQEALQLKLDKLRDQAAKSGRSDGMRKILDFKKKAKDRGITLR